MTPVGSVDCAGPVVIGGLGGSGTRAVALAVEGLGVDLGRVVDPETRDNLLFTLLCKRPEWLLPRLSAARPDPDVLAALGVLAALLTGIELDRAQLGVLAEAVADHAAFGHAIGPAGRVHPARPDARPFELAAAALAAPAAPAPWGWKEPNSHLVLPELMAAFPGLVYVHVLRHPLDMAFSSNRNQLRLWGSSAGLGGDDRSEPDRQLAWWLRSTELASARAESLGGRFALVGFEEFCRQPAKLLTWLVDELDLPLSASELDSAASAVELPASSGRWRSEDWRSLDRANRLAAGRYGFDVGD